MRLPCSAVPPNKAPKPKSPSGAVCRVPGGRASIHFSEVGRGWRGEQARAGHTRFKPGTCRRAVQHRARWRTTAEQTAAAPGAGEQPQHSLPPETPGGRKPRHRALQPAAPPAVRSSRLSFCPAWLLSFVQKMLIKHHQGQAPHPVLRTACAPEPPHSTVYQQFTNSSPGAPTQAASPSPTLGSGRRQAPACCPVTKAG